MQCRRAAVICDAKHYEPVGVDVCRPGNRDSGDVDAGGVLGVFAPKTAQG